MITSTAQIPSDGIVKFYAQWCTPCTVVSPIFNDIVFGYQSESVRFFSIDVQKADKAELEKVGVKSIPSILVFKDGKVTERMTGSFSKENIEALVNRYIHGEYQSN
jgi:thioredoxin 1